MDDRERILDYTKPYGSSEDQPKIKKNITKACFLREIGHYKNVVPSEFQWAAEDKLVEKDHEEMKCELPVAPRSTFLMVFSPDGKKVASTHGNHNVYVTDLTTGKNISTLVGHPRTPWSIAFHPSSNQILASGCLGGQVRVWDLHGGSEVWTADSQSVIASLAFHPLDRTLVIATYNELHFWDWSQPQPFAKCCTRTEREKVRYVAFDRLGTKLITGIGNPISCTSTTWERSVPVALVTRSTTSTPVFVTTTMTTTSATAAATAGSTQTTSSSSSLATTSTSTSEPEASISYCYRDLMNQYNQLVRRYFDLSRSRVTATTDRGTDPMDESDNSSSTFSVVSSSSTTTMTSRVPSLSILHQAAAYVNNNDTLTVTSTSTVATPTVTTSTSVSPPVCSFAVSSLAPRRSERAHHAGSSTSGCNLSLSNITFTNNETSRPESDDFSSLLSLANLATSERASHLPLPVTTSSQSRTSTSTSTNSSSSLRRQMFFRPGGQYVLSRHTNSPFQPRVQPTATTTTLRPRQSAASSIPESAESSTPTTARERSTHNRTHTRHSVYDHYRTLVGDRIRNTNDNDVDFSDTTIDFSSNDGEDVASPQPPPSTTSSAAGSNSSVAGQSGSLLFDDDDEDDDDDDDDDDDNNDNNNRSANSLLGKRLLSDHLHSMQSLYRARIEMFQLQRIRRMWFKLTTQVKTLHSLIRMISGVPESDASTSSASRVSERINNMMRLARISDPAPGTSDEAVPSTSSTAGPSQSVLTDDESELSSSGCESPVSDSVRKRRRLGETTATETSAASATVDAQQPEQTSETGGAGEEVNVPSGQVDDAQPSTSTGVRSLDSYDALLETYSKRIYKLLRDIIRKTRSRRDSHTVGSGRNTFRSTSDRVHEHRGSRPCRRSWRAANTRGTRNRSLTQLFREMEAMFETWRRDNRSQTTPNDSPADAAGPSTSRASGGDSCISCGKSMSQSQTPSTRNRRKSSEPTRNNGLEKLRRMDGRQPGVSASAASTSTPSSASSVSTPSTSSANTSSNSSTSTPSTSSGTPPTSRTEYVRLLETIYETLHYQRESFRLAEGVEGGSGGSQGLVYRRNFVQHRARHLLELMMECLKMLFEDTFHVLNEQIVDLCSLLHLALELTDLLLEELNLTRRDLERNYPAPSEADLASANRFLSRSSSRYRPRTLGRLSTMRCNAGTSSRSTDSRGCTLARKNVISAYLSLRRSRPHSTRSSTTARQAPATPTLPPPHTQDNRFLNRLRRLSLLSRSGVAVYLGNRRRYSPSSDILQLTDRIEDRLIDQEIEPPLPPSPPPSPPATTSTLSDIIQSRIRLVPYTEQNAESDLAAARGVRTFRVVQFNPNVQVIPDEQRPQPASTSTSSSSAASPSSTSDRPMYYFRLREPERTSTRASETSSDSQTIWIRYLSAPTSTTTTTTTTSQQPTSETTPHDSNFNVPIVQVNDVPVSDSFTGNQPPSRTRPQSPDNDASWRWRTWRPRFLNPRYLGPNPFDEPAEPNNDNVENVYYRVLNASGQLHTSYYALDPVALADNALTPHHRIQAWDFSKLNIPDISPRDKNVVVSDCKIHNDASVDVSNDGHLLVTLLTSGRLVSTTMLGVYSLDWNSLGQLLYKTSFEQSAVSVSLSPTNRYLLVGLASRALVLRSGDRTNMAQIYRLDGAKPKTWNSGRGRLVHIRDLEQIRDNSLVSLNCIRWAPGPGQGIVYGTNSGLLKVLR